jgi:hypothetical protein
MVGDAHIGGVTAQSGDVYHLGFTNVKVNKYLLCCKIVEDPDP